MVSPGGDPAEPRTHAAAEVGAPQPCWGWQQAGGLRKAPGLQASSASRASAARPRRPGLGEARKGPIPSTTATCWTAWK